MLNAAMTALRRHRNATSPASKPATNDSAPSMVVPELFQGLDKSQSLTVLDLGPASSAKVAFFSDRKCRIDFVDLLAELDAQLRSPEANEQEVRDALETLLCGNAERSIDIVLCWDVLNYLPTAALTAFHQCLAGQLHSGSRLHCFSVRHTETPIPWSEHGFSNNHQIVSKPKTTASLQPSPHTPVALNQYLPTLQVDRSILLQDGRLELLLTPAACSLEPAPR